MPIGPQNQLYNTLQKGTYIPNATWKGTLGVPQTKIYKLSRLLIFYWFCRCHIVRRNPRTSMRKLCKFFRNLWKFTRSSVVERLFEFVRDWRAFVSRNRNIWLVCLSINSFTKFCNKNSNSEGRTKGENQQIICQSSVKHNPVNCVITAKVLYF